MSVIRRISRNLYSRLFISVMRAVASGARELDAKRLRASLGGQKTLHVAAPGVSVTRNESLGGAPAAGDVLGVNYFITCRDVPLWAQARIFVIEPHETYRTYARALAHAALVKGECIVVVKGIGSPNKAAASAGLVRVLAAIPGVTVLLARDFYVTDLMHSTYAEAIVGHPHRTVSGFKTLLWTLSFAFVAGYTEIVLHGFDFSQDYAYSDSHTGESGALQPNIWVADEEHRASVLREVARLFQLFAERGILLAQSGCDGPLATVLPQYSHV